MTDHPLRSKALHAVAVAAALAGVWVCGELVRHDAGIWPEASTSLFNRVCQVWSSGVSMCDTASSGGAAIGIPIPTFSAAHGIGVRRMRMPLAFIGLAYFVTFAIWLTIVGRRRERDPWWRSMPRTIAVAGAIASALLLTRMVTGHSPACIWCMIAHGLNFVLTGSLLLAQPLRTPGTECTSPEFAGRRVARTRLAGIAIAAAVLAVGGMWYHRHEQLALARNIRSLTPYRDLVVALRSDGNLLAQEHYLAAPVDIPPRPEGMPLDASIVVFTDYNCPACRCNDRRLHAILDRVFANDAHVTVRHVSRCRACAAGEPGPHAAGCAAAYAAEAARLVGGDEAFERMHAALFSARGPWPDERLVALAEKIGLNGPRFRTALHGDAVRATISADVAAAQALGVDAVPAVFLDGRRVGPLSADNPLFWKAVAAGGHDAPGLADLSCAAN